jgi:hypothetical protein
LLAFGGWTLARGPSKVKVEVEEGLGSLAGLAAGWRSAPGDTASSSTFTFDSSAGEELPAPSSSTFIFDREIHK